MYMSYRLNSLKGVYIYINIGLCRGAFAGVIKGILVTRSLDYSSKALESAGESPVCVKQAN